MRIRELETAAQRNLCKPTPLSSLSVTREEDLHSNRGTPSEPSSETANGLGKSREVAEPHRKLWWLNSAMKATTGDDRTLFYSPEDQTHRGSGLEQSLSRGQVMTASFHGFSSLLHLVQQSVTGHKRRGRRGTKEPVRGRRHHPRPELVETMRMVLDSWTHHQNFPLPLAPSLAHFVTARDDAYIPRRHIPDVRSLWQGGWS